jgi:hypothetical protein
MVRESFAGIKKGQKFIVVANTGGHNYPIGEELYFNRDGTAASSMENIAVSTTGRTYNHIKISEIELVNDSIESMKLEIAKIKGKSEARIKELQSRIDICEELGIEVYNAQFVKVYRSLQVLNSDATVLEKTKLIIKLIE